MAAEVEAVAVAHLGPGDAADLVGRLEHDHGLALLGEQVAGGQAGRAAAEHDDGVLGRDLGRRRSGVPASLGSVVSVMVQETFW